MWRTVNVLVDREQHRLDALNSRPVLARPEVIVETRATDVSSLTARAERVFAHRLDGADRDIAHTTARLRALSPQATLDRGYAIVHRAADGQIVRAPDAVTIGDALRIRVAGGQIAASVTPPASTEPPATETAATATPPASTEPPATETAATATPPASTEPPATPQARTKPSRRSGDSAGPAQAEPDTAARREDATDEGRPDAGSALSDATTETTAANGRRGRSAARSKR